MSNNRMPKKKNVRETKAENVPPAKREIQINPGNTATLTIQLLNAINENLIAIREGLKDGRS